MPLILLLSTLAWAQGSALWLRGPADPDATAGLVDHPLELVVPDQAWAADDERALATLRSELEAVRPLVEVFDGELQIMGRLERAIADVHVLRGDEDRDLVVRALRFQGFAVQRYFQDGLATDPGAEPYRERLGDLVEVGPWVDAVALDPDRPASADEIPDEAERAAFDATRARVMGTPWATLDFGTLPEGASGRVDGRPVERGADGTARATVPTGMHRAAIFDGDGITNRGRVRLAPGEVHTLWRRPTRAEMDALAAALDGTTTPIQLDPVVMGVLSLLEAPVHLVVPSDAGLIDYKVEDTWAVLVPHAAPEPIPAPAPEPEVASKEPPRVETTASIAWAYDPSWGTVPGAPKNAPHSFAAQIGVALLAPIGPVEISAGFDVAVPSSQWAEIEGNGMIIRARMQPWFGVGAAKVPLALTIGGLLPRHLAIGLRARPLQGPIAISAGWNQGIPLASGIGPAHIAWAGISGVVPLRKPSP